MRTFIVTRSGVARVMRTYALGPGGRVITPRDVGIKEITPAPDAADEIARWNTDDQAAVASVREISEADIPPDTELWMRNGWEDDGTNIVVNEAKVRAFLEQLIVEAKGVRAGELLAREFAGEDVAAKKATLRNIDPQAAAAAPDLKSAWPAGLAR